MGTGEFNAGGNPAMDKHPIQGGVEIFPVASWNTNWDKLRPDGPLGPNADFTFLPYCRKNIAGSFCVSINESSLFLDTGNKCKETML